MGQVHDYGGSFPYLTLTHIHSDECCGLDDHGKPSFICNYEFNACTTCMATGANREEMAECVSFRRAKARRNGKDERRLLIGGCF